MENFPEPDGLKTAAIEISKIIIADTSPENCIFQLMMQLSSLGEFIISKLEEKNPSFKVACSKGCSYCCHMQVKVTPIEVFTIHNHIIHNFSIFEVQELEKRIRNNIYVTQGKKLNERILCKHQTPCIFLTDQKCDVYHARPLICRAWHSQNKMSCVRAFQSNDENAEIETMPLRNYVLSIIREVFMDICEVRHWEYGTYELPFAMDKCLSHKHQIKKWLKGGQVFDALQ